MPVKHLTTWQKYLPDARYVNLYGPTEITCNCTYYPVERKFEAHETLPIGKAFPNEKVFLLDQDDKLVTEKDQIGEICVSGTALALGYYNNPEQTKKRHLSKIPLTLTAWKRFTGPGIWPSIMRTGTFALPDERTFRSSTWDTASNWKRSKPS